jgi:hypothetical protein
MLNLDLWFRQQLWLQLWKGPGAVSTYLSVPVSLICVGLSAIGSTEFQGASLCILRLFECLPLADAEEVLVGPLKGWLELPPEYDPEGWALPLFGKF